MEVSNEILNQLGGRRFLVMTGAKNLIGDKNYLSMHLPTNKAKAKYLKIELTSADDYTMTFQTKKTVAGKLTFPVVEVCEGVYCDNLQEVFTSITGLYTSLRPKPARI